MGAHRPKTFGRKICNSEEGIENPNFKMSKHEKMSQVTITESEHDLTPRHPYNTRYSAKKFPTIFSWERKETPFTPIKYKEDKPIMDYCYNSRTSSSRRSSTSSGGFFRCCTYKKAFEIFLIIASFAAFYCYMSTHLTRLQNEINELNQKAPPDGAKKTQQDQKPQQQQCAGLEKSCASQLQHLLRDPVGRPDFALESTGGRIVNTKNTVSHSSPKTLFGLTLCEGRHGPTTMIQATSSPGECWAFKGSQGSAVIQLLGRVMVDAVTLEHIPSTLAPNGVIDSAPKDFEIWGCDDGDGTANRNLLGRFTYEKDGPGIQTFPINNTRFYEFVDFMVISNYGNQEFTCVYRLQVHGTLQKFA